MCLGRTWGGGFTEGETEAPRAGTHSPRPRTLSLRGGGRECLSRRPIPPPAGSVCHINIDECADNPCHNGGTCEDGVNGFTCRCPEGYHDPTCLSEVNECSSNPCIHGACRDSLNGYGATPHSASSGALPQGGGLLGGLAAGGPGRGSREAPAWPAVGPGLSGWVPDLPSVPGNVPSGTRSAPGLCPALPWAPCAHGKHMCAVAAGRVSVTSRRDEMIALGFVLVPEITQIYISGSSVFCYLSKPLSSTPEDEAGCRGTV